MANLPHHQYQQETLALHAGYHYDEQRTISVPIYQTTAYSFENFDQAAARFNLEEIGNTYSRSTSPTVNVLSARLAALEGGRASVCTGSGTAAVFYSLVNLAEQGDNVLFANKIYGGTQTLITHTLKRFGIEGRIFDIDDLSTLQSSIDDKTKAIFFESLSNPQIAIANPIEIANIAKAHGIISICDNTVATALLHKPLDYGIDVVVYSLSKYINGQGNTLGGALIERHGLNEFIKNNPRYPSFNEPDISQHGLIYANLDLPCFSIRALIEWLRNTGSTLSPQSAWNMIQGLETLELRMNKHSQNALAVAEFLQSHPLVENVCYPGLKDNPYHHLLKKFFKNGYGSGLLSFEARSFEAAQKIGKALELFSIALNLGDSKSLLIHPASTTHSQLSKEELQATGITPKTIRLSIGLENAQDLISDLKQAIER